MSKDHISATVDEEIADFVSRDDVNTSGLINNLLKQHMTAGTTEEQMLRIRLERVEDRIEVLESQLETKRDHRDTILSQLEEYEQQQEQVILDAGEALDRVDFRADNDKVAYWVDETGLSKEELRERLAEQDLL
jgi:hypothetical protein